MMPSGRSEIGVLVVDDQAPFRSVVRDVVAATAGFELVGEASSGPEALGTADAVRPDLVLVDVRMPVMDGVETARRLRAARPEAVVILISADDPRELPEGVEACGAAALARKQDFGPLALRRLWARHGRRDSRRALVAQ